MLAKILSATLLVLAAAESVSAHVAFSKPPIRGVGEQFKQRCGERAYTAVKNDPTGPIEYQRSNGTTCYPTLCRGLVSLFSSNPPIDY
jgi:hypothetical protein